MRWRMGVEEEEQQQEQEEQHWTCRRCSQPPANAAAMQHFAALRGHACSIRCRALICIIILIVLIIVSIMIMRRCSIMLLRGCWH